MMIWFLNFSQTVGDSATISYAIKFQNELNASYYDSVKSPLIRTDRLKFTGLKFFPINLNFCVLADFVRTPDEKVFEMVTSGAKRPHFVKYGELHFIISEKKYKLNAYKSVHPLVKKEEENYLFIPFNDLTNGKETYEGGRFMDIEIPKDKQLILDFNTCYHPLCAYNHKYSCPKPPAENLLNVEIKAGVKLK